MTVDPTPTPEQPRHDPTDHDCRGGVRGDRYPLSQARPEQDEAVRHPRTYSLVGGGLDMFLVTDDESGMNIGYARKIGGPLTKPMIATPPPATPEQDEAVRIALKRLTDEYQRGEPSDEAWTQAQDALRLDIADSGRNRRLIGIPDATTKPPCCSPKNPHYNVIPVGGVHFVTESKKRRYNKPVFTNPQRCAYCGSKGEHLRQCGNPILQNRDPHYDIPHRCPEDCPPTSLSGDKK